MKEHRYASYKEKKNTHTQPGSSQAEVHWQIFFFYSNSTLIAIRNETCKTQEDRSFAQA